jgi:hypothetical protein
MKPYDVEDDELPSGFEPQLLAVRDLSLNHDSLFAHPIHPT